MLFFDRLCRLDEQARVRDDLYKSLRSAFCCCASGDREIFGLWIKQLRQLVVSRRDALLQIGDASGTQRDDRTLHAVD